MKISVLCPSRGRPDKSFQTITRWMNRCHQFGLNEFVISLDEDDPELGDYLTFNIGMNVIVNKNRSCVDAINNAAKVATGDVLIVVSDDTDCPDGWDESILKELEGKSDYLLKTKDGIQDYIVTMTVCDRKYYERDGFIYHPDFRHQFADTYLTCLADIRGRLIFSDLEFPHRHYSISGGRETADALHHRNDLTWKEGQDTFIKLMKEFTPEERARIKDPSMRGFLRKFGL
jgi:glycosyltransferase involved in cell wall biosynthesis